LKTFYAFLIFLLFEIVTALLFKMISKIAYKNSGFDVRSMVKGVIERSFLTIALLCDYPHALTFFSALKLGTRLRRDDDNNDNNLYNDFYLIGNLISVAIAFFYIFLIKKYFFM
jgi:hypothetical protein